MAILTVTSCPFTYSPSSNKVSFLDNGRSLSIVGKPKVPCVHRKASSPLACIKNIYEEAKASEVPVVPIPDTIRAKDFPYGFTFGTGTAAYQVEGAVNVGGRLPSLWDNFVHEHPEKIKGRATGDVACDHYHKFKEDIKLIKDAGMDSFRFSISWPRILPKGTLKGGINKEGIAHYNDVINELLRNGIKPFVTLFHWDVPQELEKTYNGFLGSQIADDFKDYCEVCFREFGDRVKFWTTLNEPYIFTVLGYDIGILAPGKKTSTGDSPKDPYKVGHNLLRAHAHAVKLYKEKFQESQKGEIGIALPCYWTKPSTNSIEDIQATERSLDFWLGWFLEPLVTGDYPFIMKALVRERLPSFTEEEAKMLKGSYDFIGINYYTSKFASHVPFSSNDKPTSVDGDAHVELKESNLKGEPIGELAADKETYICPYGIKDLLVYIKNKYNDPVLYITENGISQNEDGKLPLHEALDDKERIKFHSLHLTKLAEAIRLGVKVKGYFTWSGIDDFEWSNGYTIRFGLVYIDFKDGLKRYPKASLRWFNNFLKS